MDAVHSYRARWVIPVGSPPVANGIVVVHGERIVGIHRSRRPDTVDLGDVAILPGLVNCHTHLEFSRLAEPLQALLPFTDWIRSVVNYRRSMASSPSPPVGEGGRRPDEGELTAPCSQSGYDKNVTAGTSPSPPAPLPQGERGKRRSPPPSAIGEAIQRGLHESLRSGVTLVGDIATTGWSRDDYLAGPSCVVFQELLGLSATRLAELTDLASRHLQPATDFAYSPGLSPHAPYSVHPELFRRAVELAQAANAPLAMHLAETEAERELLADGTGEFRTLLKEFGLWQPELFGGRTWTEFLDPLGELAHALVIHGNYLDGDALRFLAQHPHMTLVYCPRTHAAFGHSPHPWRTLLNLGGTVALGTDSRASNPDLSLWAELQFLAAKFPEVSQLELVRLATLNGARALGHQRDHGSLEPGKLASLIVVGPVPDDGRLLHQDLITSRSEIRAVMHQGAWIVRP